MIQVAITPRQQPQVQGGQQDHQIERHPSPSEVVQLLVPLNHVDSNFQMTVNSRHRFVPILPMSPTPFSGEDDDEEQTLVSSLSLDDSLNPRSVEATVGPTITYDQFLEELMKVANQSFVPPEEVVIPVRHQEIFRSPTVVIRPEPVHQSPPQTTVKCKAPDGPQPPALVSILQKPTEKQKQTASQPSPKAQPILLQEPATTSHVQPLQKNFCRPPHQSTHATAPVNEQGLKAQLSPLKIEFVSFWSFSPIQVSKDDDGEVLGQRSSLVGKSKSEKLNGSNKSSFNTVPTSSSTSTGCDHYYVNPAGDKQGVAPHHKTATSDPSLLVEELPPKQKRVRQIRRRSRKDLWRRFTSPPLHLWIRRRPVHWKDAFGYFA